MHNLPRLTRKHTSIEKCEILTSDIGHDPAPTRCQKKSETYCLQMHGHEMQQSLGPCTSISYKSESSRRSGQPHYQQYMSAIAVISHQSQRVSTSTSAAVHSDRRAGGGGRTLVHPIRSPELGCPSTHAPRRGTCCGSTC